MKKNNPCSLWMGNPLNTFNKKQLMDIIDTLAAQLRIVQRDNQKALELIASELLNPSLEPGKYHLDPKGAEMSNNLVVVNIKIAKFEMFSKIGMAVICFEHHPDMDIQSDKEAVARELQLTEYRHAAVRELPLKPEDLVAMATELVTWMEAHNQRGA